ncbi:Uncharacterized protein dnm_038720 [Desulfonema magnum]|uniref:Uncharacterized protein n=1 Tax=Desulfonema magnum TaxID=45655 RepID=A0A975BMW5_9BACT|nr:Uncharacterized protein dnm_038720 [Desulfonema magnum]
MEDKPVYVFDEWAADKSPHFREYFYHSMFKLFDPVRTKSLSFLRKQESVFGRCGVPEAVDSCFRRNDRKKLEHRVSEIAALI